MENNNQIKTGFILSLVSQICIDVYSSMMVFQYIAHTYPFSSNRLVAFAFLCCLVIAPFVLAIVALKKIKNETPITVQDRSFRVVTRILSIVTMVEGGLLSLCMLILIPINGGVLF